jgi:hypothetical protein
MISQPFCRSAHRCGLRMYLSVLAVLICSLTGCANAAQECHGRDPQRVLLLIDRTTAFDETGARSLREGVRKLTRSLCPEDYFAVFSIAAHLTDSEPLFEKTMPGCEDRGLMTSCDALGGARKRKQLRAEILSMIERIIVNTRSLSGSAIARTLVSTMEANGRFDRIYIWSDGFENSADCRFPNTPIAECKLTMRSRRSLQGSRITFFGAGRTDSEPRRPLSDAELERLEAFWNSLLQPAGARNVRIRSALGSADLPR